MNLFWKRLFGSIASTEKIEKHYAQLITDYKRYKEVENSVELAEYNELFHVVKAADFISNKKVLQNRKYKDTEEYKQMKQFQKLDHTPAIKTYYKVLQSTDLERYIAFSKTDKFEDLGDKKKVEASEQLRKLKNFEHSADFKTYSRFHDSYVIKEYETLKAKVNDPEFVKRNEFWSNPNRWQTTLEYKKEQRYYELHKNPDIVFFKSQNPKRFEALKGMVESFADNFDWNTLAKSHWDFGFHYKSASLIGNHSFYNEQQANNGGKNIAVENGILKIHTRHEKVKAKAWHSTKGFVEKEFSYSADVMQTAQHFRQSKGMFSAKIRCSGNVQHAFWLGSDAKLPHINVFHWDGKKIKMGNASKNIMDGVEITGINHNQFFIYTLKWTDKELIWSINDYEVYRTASNLPTEDMYLAFSSFIPEKMSASAGHIEVDWVRVYKFE